jgi:tripartite ATP-independent transporter DctM subunit
MLAAVAVVLVATGLPSWIVLLGVAMVFAACGVVAGAVPAYLLTAVPARLLGLLENDLLQALPLYVLMGALLNRLPLAGILFRVGERTLRGTGAGASLAGLGLGALLAPMNGSVGANVLMLGRTMHPRLLASGVPDAQGAALVCMASTLGVVIPPSLVLILLGDAMMRAHTEAVNVTHESVRIINTQDVFVGALVPAAILFVLACAVAWWSERWRGGATPVAVSAPRAGEWVLAVLTLLFIGGLLTGVTLGYLFAVEAAAAGGVVLVVFGLATRALPLPVIREVLRDTMAITGALFALLVAATVFTLVLRMFGTDRWLAEILAGLPGGGNAALGVVLALLALCALVLDAFELIFVVVPIVMPPLLIQVNDATWVAVLALLILQASFLLPPFGYAVLMVRQSLPQRPGAGALARAIAPYLLVQWLTLALVLFVPQLVWQKNPAALPVPSAGADDGDAGRDALIEQLRQNEAEPPADPPQAGPR